MWNMKSIFYRAIKYLSYLSVVDLAHYHMYYMLFIVDLDHYTQIDLFAADDVNRISFASSCRLKYTNHTNELPLTRNPILLVLIKYIILLLTFVLVFSRHPTNSMPPPLSGSHSFAPPCHGTSSDSHSNRLGSTAPISHSVWSAHSTASAPVQ